MSGVAPSFPLLGHRVRAVLGPTNTGKTHLAIERMLAHASGIIGFPLRLLARENYDRMVARKGAKHVALITGEEKIVPPEARWFSCTVEAMPLDRNAGGASRGEAAAGVEFLAVDEIQLCADPDRGHIFTDRLLHARGLVETMFLGAETIRPLLHRLAPEATVETRPRLSRITHAGVVKLSRLPPRSAVVAFSTAEVYAIAEMIRRRRGGCAVVMGRLSPRTRNAQVALYQAGEVDFLVATDAIGMGLNMDVDHVGFAGLSKFDGHRPRHLLATEVAQIAGRAGRGLRDGTFGTTSECPPLDEDIVRAVEEHQFEALEQICWRNSDLDFASVDALLATLNAPPPRPGLVRGNEASDVETLAALARDGDILSLARSRRRVAQLWDACQIPDFRKLADDTHTKLCARVFTHVAREGRLPTDWLAGQIGALARTDGDIDTLMQRLANVRVWAYIAARADWVADAAHWQGRAREAEDMISDALHERLIARFVDRRAARLMRRLDDGEAPLLSAVTRRGEVVVEGHPVGHVEGFSFVPDPGAEGDAKRMVLRAARHALRDEMPRRLARLEAAEDADFALVPGAPVGIAWEGAVVGRLRPGATALRPLAEARESAFLDGAQRERIRLRLQRYLDTAVRGALAPLFAALAAEEPALRGMLHQLAEGLGVVTPGEPGLPLPRPRLKALGIQAGRHGVFLPALLKPAAAASRALLWGVRNGVAPPELPPSGRVSIAPPADWPAGFAAAMGWLAAGPVLLRLDVAERVGAELAALAREGKVPVPPGLAARLGVKSADLTPVLRHLGFRIWPAAPLDPGQFGPPCPPMLGLLRRRPEPASAPAPAEGPFAALAGLRGR
jgi:ATP-dependent RNA helicase SUPV3L1/SUV3